MMDKVKIGLVGLGFMGSTHFRVYRDFVPNAQVVAVADVDPVKRTGDISSVKGNIGNDDNSIPLDFTGIKVYSNGFDMIKDADIDMVDICVPTPYHKDLIVAALAAGKYVQSEKPLCRNLEQAEEIKKAVEGSDKFFNVDMCVRAWPAYRHALVNYQAGKYGKMRAANFHRLSPCVDDGHWQDWFSYGELAGGALLDMHLHDTDFIATMFGNPKAVTSNGIDGFVSKSGIDHVITIYHYDDGALVSAEGTWGAPATAPFEMTFQIYCEKATLRLTPTDYTIYWTDGTVEKPELDDKELPTGWHHQFKYFVDCVKNGVKPDKYQTFQSVYDAFKVIMAEQESIDKKKTIEIKY